jgi:hypothetical protein
LKAREDNLSGSFGRGRIVDSLRDAACWCARAHGDPGTCLRTPQLQPRDAVHVAAAIAEMERIVSEVVGTRAQWIARRGSFEDHERRASLPAGRLLFFDPVASLSGGGTQAASAGFFDDGNTPPWDTWVYCVDDRSLPDEAVFSTVLLSWVPRNFIGVADAGIRANPEGCLSWASDASTGLTRALEQWGLLR